MVLLGVEVVGVLLDQLEERRGVLLLVKERLLALGDFEIEVRRHAHLTLRVRLSIAVRLHHGLVFKRVLLVVCLGINLVRCDDSLT